MDKPVLSVTQLLRLLKEVVEPSFDNLAVEGELSGVKLHSSGHLYFSLKDETCQVECAFFHLKRSHLSFDPKDGDRVQVRGKLSIWEQRGKLTFSVSSMIPLGLGAVLARIEDLKRQLQAEGIFDPTRKKPLPFLPKRIVLITSPTGAAVQDMLRVFRQKGAWASFLIIPAAVQGDEAPKQLCAALRYLNRWNLGDVAVIGRGGGSFEDLLAFSDEVVVRAIAASRIPIVSAVGHEVDNPISDLAADASAPTPTAAAHLVWPHVRDEFRHSILEMKTALADFVQTRLEQAASLLRPYRSDAWAMEAAHLLEPLFQRLESVGTLLSQSIRLRTDSAMAEVRRLGEVLEAHSPLGVLERGYAVVSGPLGVLTRSVDAPGGTPLSIRLHQGTLKATADKEKA